MSVDVVLFGYLAREAEGHARVCCCGETVGETLQDLTRRYPGLREKIWDERGDLNQALGVHVAGRVLGRQGDLEVSMADGEEIALLPIVAGG